MAKTLAGALTRALKSVSLTENDRAAVRLAYKYAREIDAGEPLSRLGPAYLSVLESLGLTPRARAALTGRGDDKNGKGHNPLDELRQKRDERASRAN